MAKQVPIEFRKWTVYIHTFPNDKKYVGTTSQIPERRWNNGNGYAHQKLMMQAIKEFGWESILHEIVGVFDTKETAYEEEVRLIELYKTRDPVYGYNKSIGGSKGAYGVIRDEEDKKNMSEARKGKAPPLWVTEKAHEAKRRWVVPPETRRRMAEAQIGEKNHEYGKHRTEQEIAHLRQVSPTKKPVECIETGEVFISQSEAARSKNIESSANISRCCNHKRKTAGGFHWEYACV